MKHKKKTRYRAWETALAEIAKKTASLEANSACIIWSYQPAPPNELKKLRKF